MNWFTKLERRWGRCGIPDLLMAVAVLQLVVFGLALAKPEFVKMLTLDMKQVMQGQVWRLFTFCLIPSTLSPIWILFSTMMLIWIGRMLESAWGTFRINLYYFSTVALLVLASVFHPLGSTAELLLYNSLFLAFAITFPRETILVMFVIPVQVRWLGWLTLAVSLLMFISAPESRLGIALSLIPFLIVAVPQWYAGTRQGIRVAHRRGEFASASLPPEDHFHKCEVCGRTDVSHPQLSFRVLADDTERCEEHLS
jgi:hypothetical protein